MSHSLSVTWIRRCSFSLTSLAGHDIPTPGGIWSLSLLFIIANRPRNSNSDNGQLFIETIGQMYGAQWASINASLAHTQLGVSDRCEMKLHYLTVPWVRCAVRNVCSRSMTYFGYIWRLARCSGVTLGSASQSRHIYLCSIGETTADWQKIRTKTARDQIVENEVIAQTG